MNFHIVPMDKSHLDGVARLEAQCFSHPWSKATLEDSLYQDGSSFLVAESPQDGKVLGYAGVTVVAGEGYINNVAVFPEYRRGGVADQLLQIFCNFGQEHLSFLTLEVRASNQEAQGLYLKHGFTVEATRRDYYDDPKEDAVIMTLRFEGGAT